MSDERKKRLEELKQWWGWVGHTKHISDGSRASKDVLFLISELEREMDRSRKLKEALIEYSKIGNYFAYVVSSRRAAEILTMQASEAIAAYQESLKEES